MILVEKILLLKKVPFLAHTSPDTLAWLAKSAEEQSVNETEVIFEKGSDAEMMYVIVDGSVQEYNDKKTLRTLATGECFGLLSLLDEGKRSASAKAKTSCILLGIRQEIFHRILLNHPEAMKALLNILAKRIRGQGAQKQ